MKEWEEIKFDEFIKLNRGFDLPNEQVIEGKYPIVASTNIKAYHNEFKVQPPGVVTGRSGSLGAVQYVNDKFWPLNTALYVKDFKGNYPKFVYYYLQIMHLENFNAGAGVPSLNQNHLHKIKIRIPNFSIQKQVAHILSAYDDLIETNNQRIKLLEETAQQLYKEWFVRLRFPEYKKTRFVKGVPEGWEVMKLKDYCVFKYGTMPKANLICEKGYPIFSGYGIVGFYEKYMFEDKTLIVVARGVGGTGDIKLTPNKCWLTNLAIAIFPNEINLLKYFLYYTLSEIDLRYLDSGSAQSQITIADLGNIKLLIPNVELQKNFEEIIIPIENQMENLKEQNTHLRHLRDRLLPRLVSGKLALKG